MSSISNFSSTPPITHVTLGAVSPPKYAVNNQGELDIGGKIYRITQLDGKALTGLPLTQDQKGAIDALINKVFANIPSTKFNTPSLETIKITQTLDNQAEVEGFQASHSLFKQKVDTTDSLTPQFARIREIFSHTSSPTGAVATKPLSTRFIDPPLALFTSPQVELPPRVDKTTVLIHKIPGDGDCQMHAILKALQDRYPSHPQISGWKATDLRQIGVDFAKKNLEIEPYKKALISYIGADINDFNERLEGYKECKTRYTKKLKSINEQIERIKHQPGRLNKKQLLRQKKQLQALEIQRQKILNQENKELSKIIKAKNGIKDAKEYLERVGQKGFWCGAMHLYALSLALHLPIHIYQEEFLPATKPAQQFNAGAPGTPIHLIRVNQNHYEVIAGPN